MKETLTLKEFRVCDLVAQAHVPNPENLPYVVHVGDKLDDRAVNLKWSAEPEV